MTTFFISLYLSLTKVGREKRRKKKRREEGRAGEGKGRERKAEPFFFLSQDHPW